MLNSSLIQSNNDLLGMASEYEEEERARHSLSFTVACALVDAEVRELNGKARRDYRRQQTQKHRQNKFSF